MNKECIEKITKPNHLQTLVFSRNLDSGLTTLTLFFDSIDVPFLIDTMDYSTIFFDLCFNCHLRGLNVCDGGLKNIRNNNCLTKKKKKLVVVNKKIPPHVFVASYDFSSFNYRDHRLFAIAEKTLYPLSILNVFENGKICFGEVVVSLNPFETYNNYFNSIKNNEVIPMFTSEYKNGAAKNIQTPEYFVKEWDIKKIKPSNETFVSLFADINNVVYIDITKNIYLYKMQLFPNMVSNMPLIFSQKLKITDKLCLCVE